MEKSIEEKVEFKENIVACITLYGPVRGDSHHPSGNSLLVHLEVDESRKALIADYERRLEVVDMLEEIVEWLREMVWVSAIVNNPSHTHTTLLKYM